MTIACVLNYRLYIYIYIINYIYRLTCFNLPKKYHSIKNFEYPPSKSWACHLVDTSFPTLAQKNCLLYQILPIATVIRKHLTKTQGRIRYSRKKNRGTYKCSATGHFEFKGV
jgi:hypothetical protein